MSTYIFAFCLLITVFFSVIIHIVAILIYLSAFFSQYAHFTIYYMKGLYYVSK